MSQLMLFLPCITEAGYAFQVTDNSGSVVYIAWVAFAAFVEGSLVYVVAFITNRDTNIEAEIIATRESSGV